MALTKCPECENEISDTVETCPHCGFCLNKIRTVICPECKYENSMNDIICKNCGFKLKKEKLFDKRTVVSMLDKLPRYVFLFILVVGIVLVVAGVKNLKKPIYVYEVEHIEEYEDLKREAELGYISSSGSIASTYKYIMDGYDDLIADGRKTINTYRLKTTLLCVAGIGLDGIALYWLLGRGKKNGVD